LLPTHPFVTDAIATFAQGRGGSSGELAVVYAGAPDGSHLKGSAGSVIS